MEKTRTQNSIKNVKTGAIVQIINKIMTFVVRTVFIKVLNTEYLGVNGLFTNILTILSFAELGVGTAIIYSMYKPVAVDDKIKIKQLMNFYKKAYNTIGVIVFLLGLLVVPFLSFIIKDAPNIKENLSYIYILFLLNTSISYFFTYKKSIIYANQAQSIIDNIDSCFYIIKSIVEVLILYIFKNFILYLIVEIVFTFLENFVVSLKADKLYPFLKDANVEKLDEKEKKSIFSNVKHLMIYKLGSVIMNGTDNILISMLVDVSTVGLCSNYTMLFSAIKNIVNYSLNGVSASVGNLNAVENNGKKESIFYQLTFMSYLIYSFFAISIILLANPFVELWLGKSYVMSISISIALAVSFWIEGVRNPSYTYRTTLGLFQKAKITPYIGGISNIILSIIFCKFWGTVGIFIATSISQILSYVWIDPYLIHKYAFKTSCKKYFKKYVIYLITLCFNISLCLFLANIWNSGNIIIELIKNGIICVTIPNIINILFFYKLEEFNELKEKIINLMLKKVNKN